MGFSAWSGVGKTTLIEKLTARLRELGVHVAVVKHDVHGLQLDRAEKDSARFARAGAEAVVLAGPEGTALLTGRTMDLPDLLALAGEVDLIFVEGFKLVPITRIGLCRRGAGKDLPEPPEGGYLAVVTDVEELVWEGPRFGFEDIEELSRFIMEKREDFTHFDPQGRARMVDVGDKPPTRRTAVAGARVLVNEVTFQLIKSGGVKKGDVLTAAQVAGIMGAKRTADLIPMCHPIQIHGANLKLTLDEARPSVEIEAAVTCDGCTGVEMEALTAASVAALTVYDMCKAVQRDMEITDLRLLTKTGGVHGE